jgi:anthranilate synthase/aminodeoxychorismate synthase-like glutamine amidotransferase
MLLIIDNYDSFVYNLFQLFSSLGQEVRVVRNDRITIDGVRELSPERIVLSPGPGNPAKRRDFGVCADILADGTGNIPILGVCLGHQGIIHHFGGTVARAERPMHGKTSMIRHDGWGLFEGIASPVRVMRYHSLVGVEIPECLEVTARSEDDGAVMAVQHKTLPVYGVQFHPESIMTQDGRRMLENFLGGGMRL